ncbi:MAG: hypothetical protein O2798_05105 [Chloroflexi bacterium]|nr:hypothetical protein [Chloroflexota bacterium]MDA1240206.1 hypothetical protein [Chloroflexota bacterium]MQC47820.1 hypothetical protein [Chloroflexota bacterium]
MTDSPADALRLQAREWGESLLAGPKWSPVADRVTLLLVDPPAGIEDVPVPATAGLWLTIDVPTARSLPNEYRTALTSDQPLHERHRATATTPAVTLTLLTDDGLHRLLEGVSRASIEARWQARHAEMLNDRLRRQDQFALRAGMFPAEAPERIVRTLWLELVAAARGLDIVVSAPAQALGALGEASAAVCRIACVLDGGAYPPAAYLRAASRDSRIGRRLAAWLDDFIPAASGDEAAGRRVLGSRDQAVEEVRAVLAEQYRDRPWLRTPEAFSFRAPR